MRIRLAGLVFSLLVAPPAMAGVIANESFVYPVGSLTGSNGGSGFTSAWNFNTTPSTDGVISPGLTSPYGDTAGNAVRIASGAGSLHDFSRSFAPITADGSVVWLRFLLRPDTIPSTGQPAAGIGLTGVSTGGPFIGFGDTAGGLYISNYTVGPPSVLHPTHLAAGQQYTVLARVTLASGNDTVDLWLNPNVANLPAPEITNNQLNFTLSTLHVAAFDNAVATVDQIKMGTTLADVIPEPASIALLATIATALVSRPRRRR